MAERLLPGLERRLKAELPGDVDFDRFTRGRYATDASHYQIMPLGVVAPRTIEEAERGDRDLRARRACSVLPRGGGTSQCRPDRQPLAGHRLLASISTACSTLDVAGRRCAVEPGIVLDELNRRLSRTGCGFRSMSRPPRAPPSAA